MGYNTSLMVCNEELHRLAKDPDIGKRLEDMVHDLSAPALHRRYARGYKGLRAIHTAHADFYQVVKVGGNTGSIVGFGSALDVLDSAVKLSKTKDPRERRKLINTIQREAEFMEKCQPTGGISL